MTPAREDILRRKREAAKLRRERIKNDPALWKMEQEKQRVQYARKIESKKRKLAIDMTEREKRHKRKEWRKHSKNHYNRKKKSNVGAEPLDGNGSTITPESLIFSSCPGPSGVTPQQMKLIELGKKRRKQNREKRNKEFNKLKKQNEELKKKLNTLRKQRHRAANSSNSNPSPRKRVDKLLKEGNKVTIRNKLIFAETTHEVLDEGYRSLKSRDHKTIIRKVLASNIHMLKKYRLMNKFFHISSKLFSQKTSVNRSFRKITELFKLEIQHFFERDDVSRMCPGKKDCVTLKKVKKQKRYLLGSLKHLHEKFCKISTVKVGYTTFCKLKPFWVVIPSTKDRETCACKIHANIEYLVGALHKIGAIDRKTPKEVSAYLTCDTGSVACLQRHCTACIEAIIPYLAHEDQPISYDKWLTKKQVVKFPGKPEKTVTHTTKEKVNSTLLEAIDVLETLMKKYMFHEGIMIHQYREVDQLKKRLSEVEVLVHCDFSENYAYKFSSEVQSFHFGGSRGQCSLHTVEVYFRKDAYSELSSKAICTLSKSNDHSAPAIWAHLHPVFEFLKLNVPKVKVIHFLSDSPSTQYRNKTLFYLLAHALTPILPVETATWNYTAAGHGKGAPDGIGGTLKRCADKVVAQGVDIGCFEDFVATLQACVRNVQLYVVTASEIAAIENMLPKTNEIPSYKGTMKVQQVIYSNKNPCNILTMKTLSCLKCVLCDKFTLGTLKYREESVENHMAHIENHLDVIICEDQHNDLTSSNVNFSNNQGTIDDHLLKPGTYMLVKFDSMNKKLFGDYRYVCRLEDPAELTVRGLRSVARSNREFVVCEHDICLIEKKDVIQILPSPKMKNCLRKISYVFPFSIDIKEM